VPAVQDYLLKTSGAVVQANLFVRLVNNATSNAYVSDAVTDANGKFTFTATPPPSGLYTVYTGPTGAGPWTATGDTQYVVTDPFDKTFALNPSNGPVFDWGGWINNAMSAANPSGAAAGDGIKDDTASVQTAINTKFWTLPGQHTFIVTGLTVPSGSVGLMHGAILKLKNGQGGVAVLKNADTANGNPGIQLFGGTIDGNQSNQTGTPVSGGIEFWGCNDVLLQSVTVQNTKDKGFYLRGTSGSVFGQRSALTNCWAINCFGYSYALYNNYTTAIGNFVNKTLSISADHFNIGGTYGTYIGNTVVNTTGNTGDGFAMDANNYTLIMGNQLVIVSSGPRMYNVTGGTGTRIIGNRIFGMGNPNGLYGVLVNTLHNNYVIALNQIENFLDAGTGYGLFLSGGPGDVYENNLSIGAGNRVNLTVSGGYTTINIKNNRGYNPIGMAAFALGASPYTYTNNSNVRELHYLLSNGATGVSIAKNGVTFCTSLSATQPTLIELDPTEAFTITYATATPTDNRDQR
jgi:hypothetical protein